MLLALELCPTHGGQCCIYELGRGPWAPRSTVGPAPLVPFPAPQLCTWMAERAGTMEGFCFYFFKKTLFYFLNTFLTFFYNKNTC